MTAHPLLWFWLSFAFSYSAFAQNLFQKIPPTVQHGIKAYRAEHFENALSAFEEAQTQMPSNAQLEFNRGTTLYKQGKYEEALQSLSHARELDDGRLYGDIFYNMGNTYAAMGNADDAIASYRQALRVNPQDTMARHNLEFLLSQPPSPQKDNRQNTQKSNNTSEKKPENEPPKKPPSHTPPQHNTPPGKIPPTPPINEKTHPHKNQKDSSQNTQPQANDFNEKNVDENTPHNSLPQQQEKQLSRENADKILDTFGMDEKSYEPWRFQKKTPVEGWQYEQDW